MLLTRPTLNYTTKLKAYSINSPLFILKILFHNSLMSATKPSSLTPSTYCRSRRPIRQGPTSIEKNTYSSLRNSLLMRRAPPHSPHYLSQLRVCASPLVQQNRLQNKNTRSPHGQRDWNLNNDSLIISSQGMSSLHNSFCNQRLRTFHNIW